MRKSTKVVTGFKLFGKDYLVNSWRELLVRFTSELCRRFPELPQELCSSDHRFSRWFALSEVELLNSEVTCSPKRVPVSWQRMEIRTPGSSTVIGYSETPASYIYVKGNRGAEDIMDICVYVLECKGYSAKHIEFEY
jgi:hypothetical protein